MYLIQNLGKFSNVILIVSQKHFLNENPDETKYIMKVYMILTFE